jgi:excisionase family DNA binding protein
MGDVQFLTLDEVARLLRVSKSTVKRMTAQGQMPSVKIRRGVRILREHVDNYIAKHTRSNLCGKQHGCSGFQRAGQFLSIQGLSSWRSARPEQASSAWMLDAGGASG